jgi:hypothetical protein
MGGLQLSRDLLNAGDRPNRWVDQKADALRTSYNRFYEREEQIDSRHTKDGVVDYNQNDISVSNQGPGCRPKPAGGVDDNNVVISSRDLGYSLSYRHTFGVAYKIH